MNICKICCTDLEVLNLCSPNNQILIAQTDIGDIAVIDLITGRARVIELVEEDGNFFMPIGNFFTPNLIYQIKRISGESWNLPFTGGADVTCVKVRFAVNRGVNYLSELEVYEDCVQGSAS
jgi:hypothetical protein